MPCPRIYNIAAISGGGGTVTTEIIVCPFNFGDLSPKKLFSVPANAYIVTTQIKIDIAFDDPLSTLTIGDSITADKYMKTTENDPLNPGEYETNPSEKVLVNKDIYLTITPGTSTQGSGVAVLEYGIQP
jgi:hypothetical protein